MPVTGIIRASGLTHGSGFPGISPALPPPGGGGERRVVYGAFFPTTPFTGHHHDSPRSCAGAPGRAGMVLFDGEGVPSPAPPRVIPPRSGVRVDAGDGHNRDWLPGPAFSGISRLRPLILVERGCRRTVPGSRQGARPEYASQDKSVLRIPDYPCIESDWKGALTVSIGPAAPKKVIRMYRYTQAPARVRPRAPLPSLHTHTAPDRA